MHNPQWSFLVAMAPALLALAPQAAEGQYNITTLLMQGAQIGKTSSRWNVNNAMIPTLPLSIWDKSIAFVQCSCNGTTPSTDGVWVEDWSTGVFTQLVEYNAVARGPNEAALTSFEYAVVAGDWVVFLAQSSAGDGYYAVPLKGGNIRVIADQNTALPGINVPVTYGYGWTSNLPQFDGQHFVFYGTTGGLPGSGIFMYDFSTAQLSTIAYSTTVDNVLMGNLVEPTGLPCNSVPASVYNQPRLEGGNVAFSGSPSNGGPVWLFVTPLAGFSSGETCPQTGYLIYPATVASNTPLPPDEPSTVGFDGSYIAGDSLGNTYFEASGDGSRGVFLVNANGITPIVNTTQSLPDMGPPYAPGGGTQGLAAESGTLAFSLGGEYGSSPENAGLFTYNVSSGNVTRVAVGSSVGAADILGGFQGYDWPPPIGPNSISEGRIVFSFGNPGGVGIFLASPSTCASDVTSEVTATQTTPHYNASTQQYNSKVTVKNTSGRALPAPVSAVFNGMTNVVATYGTYIPQVLNTNAGATSCLSPLGEAYVVLNGGKALAAGAETSVELTIAYPAPPAGPLSYATRVVTGKTR